jgi:hypothetical protein
MFISCRQWRTGFPHCSGTGRESSVHRPVTAVIHLSGTCFRRYREGVHPMYFTDYLFNVLDYFLFPGFIKHGYMSIPMLVKQNSVIATGDNDSRPIMIMRII